MRGTTTSNDISRIKEYLESRTPGLTVQNTLKDLLSQPIQLVEGVLGIPTLVGAAMTDPLGLSPRAQSSRLNQLTAIAQAAQQPSTAARRALESIKQNPISTGMAVLPFLPAGWLKNLAKAEKLNQPLPKVMFHGTNRVFEPDMARLGSDNAVWFTSSGTRASGHAMHKGVVDLPEVDPTGYMAGMKGSPNVMMAKLKPKRPLVLSETQYSTLSSAAGGMAKFHQNVSRQGFDAVIMQRADGTVDVAVLKPGVVRAK